MTVTDFGGLRIGYDARLLQPRGWTVAQSLWAHDLLATLPPGPVLELCAGAGQIGLRAIHGTDRPLLCVDDNPAAGDHIALNAAAAGLEPQVTVRQASLERALADDEQFALVIADPPWVPRARVQSFPEDPVHAIDGGPDGLAVARLCLEVARDHLLPGGAILIQVGPGQSEQLAGELDDLDLREVRHHGDRGELLHLVPTRCAA